MPSLHLTPTLCFESRFVYNLCSSLMVDIQKANACSPWTLYFKIKEASIATLEDKTKLKSL